MSPAVFKIDAKGWLSGVKIAPSPNFNLRPHSVNISLLVIHCISLPPEQFSSNDVIAFFQNRLDCTVNPDYRALAGVKVSAHFYISREGDITQCVSIYDRAWHAGVSSFEGVENCNDYSIGIELSGCDSMPYTALQYERLIELTLTLQSSLSAISKARITSHAEIALPKGRKTDPGPGFNWDFYLRNIEE